MICAIDGDKSGDTGLNLSDELSSHTDSNSDGTLVYKRIVQ